MYAEWYAAGELMLFWTDLDGDIHTALCVHYFPIRSPRQPDLMTPQHPNSATVPFPSVLLSCTGALPPPTPPRSDRPNARTLSSGRPQCPPSRCRRSHRRGGRTEGLRGPISLKTFQENSSGEPRKFDPAFRGPVHNRSCTDVVCCIIFIIGILGYIALGSVAWIHGDPRKVVYPTDSHGQFCGQQGTNNANKAILFYFNILRCANPSVLINLQCPTTQLCVSKCPDRFATYREMKHNYKNWEYYKQFCRPGFDNPEKSVDQVLRDEDCPSMIVPSRPFLQRCFPDFVSKNGTLTVHNQRSFKDGDGATRSVADLRDAAK
ncbi:hypothetical protein NHX12_032965 [Muraenolepis orangiensis]|uniref:Uncharacterized protein n=1 Tax=Muraenolepis orangiensis TaxID=630683 RepID=A0A9Q0E1M2_9TELE|nr:hypothetical protein NHX12_032965 [Muraenolepis orangiensis]